MQSNSSAEPRILKLVNQLTEKFGTEKGSKSQIFPPNDSTDSISNVFGYILLVMYLENSSWLDVFEGRKNISVATSAVLTEADRIEFYTVALDRNRSATIAAESHKFISSKFVAVNQNLDEAKALTTLIGRNVLPYSMFRAASQANRSGYASSLDPSLWASNILGANYLSTTDQLLRLNVPVAEILDLQERRGYQLSEALDKNHPIYLMAISRYVQLYDALNANALPNDSLAILEQKAAIVNIYNAVNSQIEKQTLVKLNAHKENKALREDIDNAMRSKLSRLNYDKHEQSFKSGDFATPFRALLQGASSARGVYDFENCIRMAIYRPDLEESVTTRWNLLVQLLSALYYLKQLHLANRLSLVQISSIIQKGDIDFDLLVNQPGPIHYSNVLDNHTKVVYFTGAFSGSYLHTITDELRTDAKIPASSPELLRELLLECERSNQEDYSRPSAIPNQKQLNQQIHSANTAAMSAANATLLDSRTSKTTADTDVRFRPARQPDSPRHDRSRSTNLDDSRSRFNHREADRSRSSSRESGRLQANTRSNGKRSYPFSSDRRQRDSYPDQRRSSSSKDQASPRRREDDRERQDYRSRSRSNSESSAPPSQRRRSDSSGDYSKLMTKMADMNNVLQDLVTKSAATSSSSSSSSGPQVSRQQRNQQAQRERK